jgi:hypothetical protein
MKKLFKIKWLPFLFAACMPLAAISAEAPGATDGKRLSAAQRAEQHQARIAECKADPEKCCAERQAHHAQWCNANPERCKAMQARMEQRVAECKANPEKCRAERMARFEQRFKLADADGNGMISRAEAEKAMPRLVRHFDRIDADRDGQITKDEIAAARKAHFEQRQRRLETPKI